MQEVERKNGRVEEWKLPEIILPSFQSSIPLAPATDSVALNVDSLAEGGTRSFVDGFGEGWMRVNGGFDLFVGSLKGHSEA